VLYEEVRNTCTGIRVSSATELAAALAARLPGVSKMHVARSLPAAQLVKQAASASARLTDLECQPIMDYSPLQALTRLVLYGELTPDTMGFTHLPLKSLECECLAEYSVLPQTLTSLKITDSSQVGDFPGLRALSGLVHLDAKLDLCDDYPLPRIPSADLAALGQLTYLDMSGHGFNNPDLRHMTGLQTLLAECPDGYFDLSLLPRASGLRRLELFNTVTTHQWDFACPTLETLVMAVDRVEDLHFVLRGCPRLQDFDVHGQLSYEAELHELLVYELTTACVTFCDC
jgi:hypothetical protein